jgi:hypothetical protein
MFKNVLVGVDGRANGRDAIALAARLVDPDGTLTSSATSPMTCCCGSARPPR